ncbi:MAG: hypothetical protein ACRDSK_04725 [Actinophytocola sp.]|uniref:hypothetical protein n=1 Tax=Actinophytocola sp. TaxID=1872138 RepID=UPI003D6C4094
MSTFDADLREPAPHGVVDLAVNRLFQVGLDLHQALAQVHPQHNAQAGQRIRTAIGRVDETIDELRHAAMLTGGAHP